MSWTFVSGKMKRTDINCIFGLNIGLTPAMYFSVALPFTTNWNRICKQRDLHDVGVWVISTAVLYITSLFIVNYSQKSKVTVTRDNMDTETFMVLTHWGHMTHICVGKITIIGPDNGLSPGRHQAIVWTNAGTLLIGPSGTNFGEILIEIITFSLKKIRLKVSSAKRRPFCLGLNVLKMIP